MYPRTPVSRVALEGARGAAANHRGRADLFDPPPALSHRRSRLQSARRHSSHSAPRLDGRSQRNRRPWRRLARAPEAVAGLSSGAASLPGGTEPPRASKRDYPRRSRGRCQALPTGAFDRAAARVPWSSLSATRHIAGVGGSSSGSGSGSAALGAPTARTVTSPCAPHSTSPPSVRWRHSVECACVHAERHHWRRSADGARSGARVRRGRGRQYGTHCAVGGSGRAGGAHWARAGRVASAQCAPQCIERARAPHGGCRPAPGTVPGPRRSAALQLGSAALRLGSAATR